MSRPPTDRSAEAVARAFADEMCRIFQGRPRDDGMTWDDLAECAAKLLRARDAAWRRAVRKVKAEARVACGRTDGSDTCHVIAHRAACDRVLATAPGARGTKGGRRG